MQWFMETIESALNLLVFNLHDFMLIAKPGTLTF